MASARLDLDPALIDLLPETPQTPTVTRPRRLWPRLTAAIVTLTAVGAAAGQVLL